MPLALRAQVLASLVLPFASASILTGCGAATTPPTHPEVEVVVPKTDAPKDDKPKDDKPSAKAQENTLEKLLDTMNGKVSSSGVLTGLLDSAPGGVVGGVVGGVIGGTGSGPNIWGGVGSGVSGTGLGLGGLGLGGGGGGTIGLGSIGTIGRGSGTLAVINPVPGNAIHANGRSIVSLGDLATLGVSLEDATRALRGQSYGLHRCYEEKGLDVSATVEGEMSLRIVIGRDGAVAYATSDSQRPSRAVVSCVTKALMKTFVATPAGGTFGAIETTIAFAPKK